MKNGLVSPVGFRVMGTAIMLGGFVALFASLGWNFPDFGAFSGLPESSEDGEIE